MPTHLYTGTPRAGLGRALLPSAALIVLLLGAVPARAQDNLRREIAAVAATIKKVLEGHDETAVSVGQFRGPEHLPANAGPGICNLFREELARRGLKVQSRARFEVKGAYEDVIDRKTSSLILKITTSVEDRTGGRLLKVQTCAVFGEEVVAGALGLTVDLPPGLEQQQRTDRLAESIDKETFHQRGHQVFASAKGLYGLEILVKDSGRYQPREPRGEKGLAYVPLKRDEVYAVRLLNNSEHEAAVTLTIDGLSLFSFCELRDERTGQPLFSKIIVPAGQSVLVAGWPINRQTSNEFLVTEYAKSAAAELKSNATVGVVTACFTASWPKNASPPDGEPQARSANQPEDATGRGATITARLTSLERRFGVLRGSVSIRYAR